MTINTWRYCILKDWAYKVDFLHSLKASWVCTKSCLLSVWLLWSGGGSNFKDTVYNIKYEKSITCYTQWSFHMEFIKQAFEMIMSLMHQSFATTSPWGPGNSGDIDFSICKAQVKSLHCRDLFWSNPCKKVPPPGNYFLRKPQIL